MTKINEFWRPVKHYEDTYEVSNLGNVRRLSSTKNLVQVNNGNNYLGVSLSVNGKPKRIYVHRIVAMTFLDNPESKAEVNHIDGNRLNNTLSNLEWVTRSENHFHRYKVLNQDGVNKGKTGALNWKSKYLMQMDINGKHIKTFAGGGDAEKETGIKRNLICHAARTGKKGMGYLWKYI